MRNLVGVIFILLSIPAYSSQLSFVAYQDMFGMNKVYLKNEGKKDITVVTANLSRVSVDNIMTISPPDYFVKINGKSVSLKQSISKFNPITLKPGEIANVEIILPNKLPVVKYEIDEKWAKMHKTWSGSATLKVGK